MENLLENKRDIDNQKRLFPNDEIVRQINRVKKVVIGVYIFSAFVVFLILFFIFMPILPSFLFSQLVIFGVALFIISFFIELFRDRFPITVYENGVKIKRDFYCFDEIEEIKFIKQKIKWGFPTYSVASTTNRFCWYLIHNHFSVFLKNGQIKGVDMAVEWDIQNMNQKTFVCGFVDTIKKFASNHDNDFSAVYKSISWEDMLTKPKK